MAVDLRTIQAFLIDLDGVVYRGTRPIAGARELIAVLESRGVPFLFVTNNSTRTPEQVADHLTSMDIAVGPQHVLTSATVAAEDLARSSRRDQRVFVVGSTGIHRALAAHKITVTEDHSSATVVIVGLDREITYERLALAALAVGRGARFVATNDDASFPSERGLEPGAGALVAVIRTTTAVEPHVYGKPEAPMFEEALRRVGTNASRTAIIGDRYETDIVGGLRAGLLTLAVTSGAHDADHFHRQESPPGRVFPSVQEIVEELG